MGRAGQWQRAAATCATVAALIACGQEKTVTQQAAAGEVTTRSSSYAAAQRALVRAMADSTQWPTYGRSYSNERWSPLTQINRSNVGRLQLAWVNHSGIPHASESNPVVVNGTMYITTALNHVLALDAATGARKWEYVHQYSTTADCCSTNNRGVAVYDGKVYMGTVDARLVALDAKDGHTVWNVQVGDNDLGYHLTGAPTAVDGMIITGVSGGEQGCRCYVDAYDARTGRRLWRWYTIPSPAQGGWWGTWRTHDEWGMSFNRDIAREKADSAKYADSWKHGGGPMWHHPAYDPATGTLFLNIGNAAPDLNAIGRPGDNLYTASIVALDAKTGTLKWYYQEVPHDRWDYDATTPPVLVTVQDTTGRMVKAVAEAGKDGFVYVLDRATGKPIRKSQPFVPFENYMANPTPQGVIVNPGTLGGSDWSPTAYSPRTGYLYINANYLPMKERATAQTFRPPAQYWAGSVVAVPAKQQYGLYVALDLNTGKIAWRDSLAKPTISGSVATAGGVVFTGLTGKKFVAYDARTGQQLWSYATDAGVNAPPITYEIDGTQYVAVAATGIETMDSPRGDETLVFALPAQDRAGPQPRATGDTARRGGV
ncbi:MAG TPA: PQQ-dependent dehydrogenase, methanol/ethanol family [Gemmatimonadaceae bacterium]|nr:PQQ-dependent dehydrogenase, methanol/ethanol family [Gemmatimonadaceae bacterium]